MPDSRETPPPGARPLRARPRRAHPRRAHPVAALASRTAALALLAALCACGPGEPDEAPRARAGEAAARTEPARLVVLLVVDQLPPWQLERLAPWLEGGLGRFLDEGQQWRRAEHELAITETGPGHATLSTGLSPARHGIVANEWRDEDGRTWNCVDDERAPLLGAQGPLGRGRAASGHLLRAPGLAARVRAAFPDGHGARTVGIALKDRSAILGAGGAELALWWDEDGEGFVTSRAFAPELPEWVARWNAKWWRKLPAEEGHVVWREELPAAALEAGTAPDERPGEARLYGRTSFPHASGALGSEPDEATRARLALWVEHSPFGDELTLDLAGEALRELWLGADDTTDVLVIGLSACDFVGHAFGPRSREVTDLLLRTDRALGRFLERLDEEVGRGRWVAALSADHGVCELPEELRRRGVNAFRLGPGAPREAAERMRVTLEEEFARDLIQGVDLDGLRLSSRQVRAAGLDLRAVRRRARELYLEQAGFVERAFTLDELTEPGARASDDPLLRRMAASTFPGRSPDVAFARRPHLVQQPTGTGHGSPWDYDRRVPLVFLGKGSPAEVRDEPVRTVDALPTLLARAGLAVPQGLEGRVLPGAGGAQ